MLRRGSGSGRMCGVVLVVLPSALKPLPGITFFMVLRQPADDEIRGSPSETLRDSAMQRLARATAVALILCLCGCTALDDFLTAGAPKPGQPRHQATADATAIDQPTPAVLSRLGISADSKQAARIKKEQANARFVSEF